MAFLFTSESVSEGHPDKVSDQISDAILDAILEQDPMSRVACETACTTGLVLVMGEITTKAQIDIQSIVRETVREIGYDRAKYGFDGHTCAVVTSIDDAVITVIDEMLGDINLDEVVDMNDAILLLQHSMFPELYPIG